MTTDDLVLEIEKVFSALKRLEIEGAVAEVGDVPAGPALTFKQAFRKDQVACMICGKTGFKTLTRHLKQTHDMKPGQYRKQFNIPTSQSLTAKNYSEARRQTANENNLAANLVKARAARVAKNAPVVEAKLATEPVKPTKEAKPAKAARKPAKSKPVAA